MKLKKSRFGNGDRVALTGKYLSYCKGHVFVVKNAYKKKMHHSYFVLVLDEDTHCEFYVPTDYLSALV